MKVRLVPTYIRRNTDVPTDRVSVLSNNKQAMMLQAAVLGVLLGAVHSLVIPASFERMDESSGNNVDVDEFSVSTLLEKANRNIGKNKNDPVVMYGDIAVPSGLQNADPCIPRGCKWPKASDGNVYVPYRISNAYSRREKNVIIQAMQTFSVSTCIRFTPLNRQQDFVDIQSRQGCYSFVGRRGRSQTVSLMRGGCVFLSIVQHELLHALGFDHEQTRSDRDQHVRILQQNIIPGMVSNFRKIPTNNLNTPYDYNSVMHYARYAFSRNRQPTIVPIPNANAVIGRATRMSPIDILRVNRLYRCNVTVSASAPTADPEVEEDILL